MQPAPGAVDRTALDSLFRPRRLTLVGASDKNLFSRRAFAQAQRIGGGVVLVNPRSPVVHGQATVASCADVPGGIDCAYLLTPQHATLDALDEAAAAGARAAVVLSQGWAEDGGEGVARQQALVARAEAHGMVLLGPNHLGFANLHDRVAACGLGLDLPVEPGSFALVSQSGAVGSSIVGYAARHHVRFSFVITTGNEAMVSVADALRYVVEDPRTRSVGIFAETLRKPEVVVAALQRAAELGKAVVVLKAGSSELAARTAAAHTGALVGDDGVIDAVLRQHGAIRVRSLEDLVSTARLAAETGPLRAPGVGVLSVSGGACDLIADRGDELGLSLPPLSEQAVARMSALLPSYAHAQNPLDVTGGALADPDVWRNGIAVLAAEPAIGLIGVVTSLPAEGEPQREETFEAVGGALRLAGLPGVVFPQMDQEPTPRVREVQLGSGVTAVLPGVDRFVASAAHLARWSQWLHARRGSTPFAGPADPVALPPGPVGEHAAREVLARAGVPVVPAVLTTSADDAAGAAAAQDGPVVMKVCSRDIAHKSDIGGVRLGVVGEEAVRAAFEDLRAAAEGVGARFEGVLVSPLRSRGDELIVGVARDPDWGLVLAVGLGGELVELLGDVALRVLPVDRDDVREMLDGLRGAKVLHGYRGRPLADLDRVVDAICGVADLAQRLPADVAALEVNPLRVRGEEVEALDVLISRDADGS